MKLSICIPTHHGRCEFLRQAVDEILLQATGETSDNLQICISDNASEDGTKALVAEYCRRYPDVFVYRRNEMNFGFLGNLLRVVELADGDFCWLLSSDDQFAAGGLKRVQQALQEYPETSGVTVFTEGFERDMSARSPHQNNPVILPPDPHSEHVYRTSEKIFQGCGLFHGCFSAQIVSRVRWNAARHTAGTKLAQNIHFPHLYLIGLMVNAHPCWVWLPELTVKARRDNDALTSQLNRNLLRYQVETMRDLSTAWAALLGRGSPVYKNLMGRAYADQWNGQATLTLKIHSPCRSADEWAALREYTRRLYFLPLFWRSTFPVLLAPRPLLRLGFFLKSCGKLFLRSRRGRRSGAAA